VLSIPKISIFFNPKLDSPYSPEKLSFSFLVPLAQDNFKIMKEELTIILANLPEEGAPYEGELDKSVLLTKANDLAQCHSTLYYDIHVQRFDNELLLRGFLEATLEMCCVKCNLKFLQTVEIEEFSSSEEITSGAIDVTEILREEIFIEAPISPNCEDGDEKMTCEPISEHLAVDKHTEPEVNEPPEAEKGKGWSNDWDALEGFKSFNDPKD